MDMEITTPNETALDLLKGYEDIIERGQHTFVAVGNALAEIRERKLYTMDYKSFQDYCKQRWGFMANYANKLIAASEVVDNLAAQVSTIVPSTESQARPLTQLPPEKQAAAWEDAVDLAKERGKPITGAVVEEVVKLHVAQTQPYSEEDAVPVGEWEEVMKESNRKLESLARSITAIQKDAVELHEPHMDSYGRLGILESQLKTAAGTVRAAKGQGRCVYCKEDTQSGCKWCRGTGWLDKQQLESAPQK
jgi:hypothetical protein